MTEESAYVHYCPNETIQGVATHQIPEIKNHLVADMSSVILSEPLDVSKFSLIYAGAQKNLGIPGVTICIFDRDFIQKEDLTSYMNINNHSDKNSIFNKYMLKF